jgi:hypothetical protein
MLDKAEAADHVRILALSVKACYTRQNAPEPPPVSYTLLVRAGNPAISPSAQASSNFPTPVQSTAMFGTIHVHYDEWSEYEEPTVYSLRIVLSVHSHPCTRVELCSRSGTCGTSPSISVVQ